MSSNTDDYQISAPGQKPVCVKFDGCNLVTNAVTGSPGQHHSVTIVIKGRLKRQFIFDWITMEMKNKRINS